MTIKKVWIVEGCIADGICNEICPEVFGLDDAGEAYVEKDADFSANEEGIKDAAEQCRVEIIRFEEE